MVAGSDYEVFFAVFLLYIRSFGDHKILSHDFPVIFSINISQCLMQSLLVP